MIRILTATLRAALFPIVGPQKVEAAVAAVIALGWRPPLRTLLTVEEVDALPNGTPVLVGRLGSGGRPPLFGFKREHSVEIQGDPHLYALHDPKVAPPLPCTVVWTQAPDLTNFGTYADGTEQSAVLDQLMPEDPS